MAETRGPLRVAVVGGGISGLTAAYRLTKLLPEARVELFDASDRLGGVLHTEHQGELLIERGADSFVKTLPWGVELCRELGIEGELIDTNPGERRALILRGGKLHPAPRGFVVIEPKRILPLLRSPLLSLRGRLRVAVERFIPAPAGIDRPDFDVSVAEFATQRLGREAFDWLVQPLLAGIYTADAARLSLAATMPAAIDKVRKHGSLRRAARCEPVDSSSGARYANFVTPRRGLGQLVDALADRLPRDAIHLGCKASAVECETGKRWVLRNSSGESLGRFAGVVIALPAPRAAELVAGASPELRERLAAIEYASSAVVCLEYRREQIADPLAGFGFVAPAAEGRRLVAASYSSVKFLHRAPAGRVLLRAFLGGALQPEALELDDDALCRLAQEELAPLLRITGSPTCVDLTRWREKMPQYHLGHIQNVDRIESLASELKGLELAGNAYRGVGIPQCVRSGNEAANRLAEYLHATP